MLEMNNFDAADFLANFWQQKPLLIRQAFADVAFLEADELAGLALEEEVESRIIKQSSGRWQVDHGPFEEGAFAELGERDWTLLVQGVDHWVPEVQQILAAFSFLPRWRLDDVMVSFAPVGGTVSQHYDFFDVFLIQGEGKRRWQVGQVCDSNSELEPDTSVRILKEFDAVLDVELEPGDVLYVPARHAHLGVSLENSLTYSVGFKAPSIRDIVDGVANAALEDLLEEQRYQDTTASLAGKPGEINAAVIAHVKQMLQQALDDEQLLRRYFASAVTEAKYPDLNAELAFEPSAEDEQNWRRQLGDADCVLFKNPASRFAYTLDGTDVQLYVDGQGMVCSRELASFLADNSEAELSGVAPLAADEKALNCLLQLLALGVIELEA